MTLIFREECNEDFMKMSKASRHIQSHHAEKSFPVFRRFLSRSVWVSGSMGLLFLGVLFMETPTVLARSSEGATSIQMDAGETTAVIPSARKPVFTIPVPARDNPPKDSDAAAQESAENTGELTLDGIDSETDPTDGTPTVEAAPAESADKIAIPRFSDAEKTEKKENEAPTTEGTASTDVKAPYDPVQENGLYFVDWEKPDMALVLTGLLEGYIEPCGCAGMERMKGGLSRRATFLSEMKEKGWPIAAVDTGLITNGYGFQEELKMDMAVNAFSLMDYAAIGISQNELRFPAHYLLKFTVPPSAEEQSLFVSANVGVYGFLDLYTLPFKTFERGGVRIGVTSVIETSDTSPFDEKILTKPAEERLAEILPQIKKENCDHLILIAHGSAQFVNDLADRFPEFDIIMTGDSPTTPPVEPLRTEKGQFIVEVGEKGKYAVVLGVYGDQVRYQRVALDSRYKQSKDVHLLMAEYQDVLRGLVEGQGYKGLGLTSIESPNRPLLGDYVGSAKCESCHEESYRVWRENRHSSAWQSISLVPPTEHSADPPRDCDPECVSCHVVGWNGSESFPYIGGFNNMKTTPHLANVGCESCHGPGSKHIEAEMGGDTALQDKFRDAMRLGDTAKQVCYSCHDADNSPNFDFDTYYKVIEHSEGLGDDEEASEEMDGAAEETDAAADETADGKAGKVSDVKADDGTGVKTGAVQ